MKLKNIGRTALVSGMSLAIAFGATACSRDYTVAYVYATSANGNANGTVSGYAVDYQSGALTQLAGSPFAGTTGRNPVYLVASPNGQYIYTVNHDDSSITVFAVGTDGKLYPQQNQSLSPTVGAAIFAGGSFPTSATIDSTGAFLYVTFTLQNQYSTTSYGKGGVEIFPIQSNGQLGNPSITNVGFNPMSVAVSQPFCYTTKPATGVTLNAACNSGAGNYVVYVYVADQEGSVQYPTNVPSLLGYSQNMTTGALTPLASTSCTTTLATPCTGTPAGVKPSSVVIDPTTRYVYAADQTSNQIYGYQISNNTTGALVGLTSSPSIAGLYPNNLVIDPRGKYLLGTNYDSNTVSSYTINSSNGSLGGVAGIGAAAVATAPTCVTIEPALGVYVYTSNSLDNSISGLKMDANTGQLANIANTPFPTSTLPTCVVSVANGSHATSVVNP
jgi:6-phosphogluconolactonase